MVLCIELWPLIHETCSLPLSYILSLLRGVCGGVTLNNFPNYLVDLMIKLDFELLI